ncbi:MAG: hypothetical protein BWY92_01949 [Firmicutes bacterium ADurb.BinA052]|nr:MAG: hypothetical protein BWY92_01949 [Firmicutes bacterium ADurb.BinA052]
MLELVLIRQGPVTAVELLGQDEQPADAIAVLRKVSRVAELISMAREHVGPDVFDLEAIPSAVHYVGMVSRLISRLRFYVIGNAGKHSMQVVPVLLMNTKAAAAGERVRFA